MKPSDPRDKLIDFMMVKKALLVSIYPDIPDYFTNEDEDDLRGWPEDVASEVVGWIRWSFPYIRVKPSDGELCPFCILYNHRVCEKKQECTYGKRHGFCGADVGKDTYSKIIEHINEPSLGFALVGAGLSLLESIIKEP